MNLSRVSGALAMPTRGILRPIALRSAGEWKPSSDCYHFSEKVSFCVRVSVIEPRSTKSNRPVILTPYPPATARHWCGLFGDSIAVCPRHCGPPAPPFHYRRAHQRCDSGPLRCPLRWHRKDYDFHSRLAIFRNYVEINVRLHITV
jgi:hypothetical protein